MNGIYAQNWYCEFDCYQSPFQFIDSTKANLISPTDSAWHYWEDSISIGFNFQMNGESYVSVMIYSEPVFNFFQHCPGSPFPLGPVMMFFVGVDDRGGFS